MAIIEPIPWSAFQWFGEQLPTGARIDKAYADQVAAQQAALQSPLQTAAMQLENQGRETSNEANAFNLEQARKNAPVQDISRANALIANALAQIDPSSPNAAAQFDAAMDRAAQAGAGAAALQWKGRYSPATLARLAGVYSAGSALQAQQAMQNPSPLAMVTPGAPTATPAAANDPEMAAMFANTSPEQMGAMAQKLGVMQQALQEVQASPNPAAAWDQKARELGHPDWVGRYSPLQVAELQASLTRMSGYLAQRAMLQDAGVPGPIVPANIQGSPGVGYVSVNPYANNGQGSVTQIQAPADQFSYAGVNAAGNPVVLNTRSGQFSTDTGSTIVGRPGAAGRGSVYEQKRQAWLQLHPNDFSGALDYASGRKSMTQAQARQAADAQASRDLSNLTLAGSPPDDPQAYLRTRADEVYNDLTTASGQSIPSAPPAPVAQPHEFHPWLTDSQRQALRQFPNPTGKIGTTTNPYLIRDAAAYARLPKGAAYIGPDGKPHIKG